MRPVQLRGTDFHDYRVEFQVGARNTISCNHSTRVPFVEFQKDVRHWKFSKNYLNIQTPHIFQTNSQIYK